MKEWEYKMIERKIRPQNTKEIDLLNKEEKIRIIKEKYNDKLTQRRVIKKKKLEYTNIDRNIALYMFYNTKYLEAAFITINSFLECYGKLISSIDVYYIDNEYCELDKKKHERMKSMLYTSHRNLKNIKELKISKEMVKFYISQKKYCEGNQSAIPLSVFTYEMLNSEFQKYDKVFCVDADVIFLKPNIEFITLQNFDIGGCPDLGFNYNNLAIRTEHYDYEYPLDYKKTILKYNAGFFVINPKRFDLGKEKNALLEYHIKNIDRQFGKFFQFDQDIIGSFLQENKRLTSLCFDHTNNCLKRVLVNNRFSQMINEVNMIHYVGAKPFKDHDETNYSQVRSYYWNKFSKISLKLLKKKLMHKNIHIFCKSPKKEYLEKLTKKKDVIIYFDDIFMPENNILKIYFNGLTSKLQMGLELMKKEKSIVFCLPNLYRNIEVINKINENHSPYYYINYFKELSEQYDNLRKNYLRIDIKNNNLPQTEVSCILLALMMIGKRKKIYIYDINLSFPRFERYNGTPHNYQLDISILNKIVTKEEVEFINCENPCIEKLNLYKKDNYNYLRLKSLKESMKNQRLNINKYRCLKNCFLGKRCIIVSCGPSLKKYVKYLSMVDDEKYVIICIKSAINLFPGKSCIHVLNSGNILEQKKLKYQENQIGIYGHSCSWKTINFPQADMQFQQNKKKNVTRDIIDDKTNIFLNDETFPSGDIFYELAMSTALHMGIKDIYVFGLDYTYLRGVRSNHFNKEKIQSRETMKKDRDYKQWKLFYESSEHLTKYLMNNFGTTIALIGDKNDSCLSPNIKRISLKKFMSL